MTTKSIRVLNEDHVMDSRFVDRFWTNVRRSDGPSSCWPWQAASNHSGYGVVSVRRTVQLAHRLSWRIHNGPIPAGMVVMHTCDNPPCCRPDHLILGLQADNSRDAVDKGHFGGGYRRENTTKWSSPKQEDRGRPGRMVYLPRDLHAALDALALRKVNLSALAEEALRAHPKVAVELARDATDEGADE
jgi:hypothetical protein